MHVVLTLNDIIGLCCLGGFIVLLGIFWLWAFISSGIDSLKEKRRKKRAERYLKQEEKTKRNKI